VLWLDHGGLDGDDTDSHIDTLARLASADTIVYTGAGEIKGSQRDGLLKMRAQLATFTTDRGKPYTLVELPLPRPMKDDNGDPLPATYCNYLVTPSAILMPTYNQSDLDAEAAQILERVYARQVIGIDCSVLVEQHGSLHCATMQIPRQLINNTGI
ncbi:MAG: agmatine deiminase family protein, partial [Paramuribaculum intestinale]